MIRPGVQIVTAGSQCTANFVFKDLNTDDVLIGLAAHCVPDAQQGDPSTIYGVSGAIASTGSVAYSSWWNQDANLDF